MKAEKRGNGSIDLGTGDELIAMQIAPEAMGKIMNVLTDMYADSIAAVIREYSTNALDAHVEADNDDPIEVTINDEWIVFRDFGAGMDSDDIRNVYSRYGASTKSDSNDFVGMLGLGSKSALTYTDEFWVLGFKDGVQTHVQVGRDGDGAPYMNIISVDATDEPNGVEVSVPIKPADRAKFIEKAKDFFKYWRNNPVLLNGKSPERLSGISITDTQMIDLHSKDQYTNTAAIVMGNVAYPCTALPRNLVAWVEIGAVDIAPSREALQSTAKNSATIASIRREYDANQVEAMNGFIAAAKTGVEAIELYLKAKKIGLNVKYQSLNWNGHQLPTTVYFQGREDGTFVEVPNSNSTYRSRRQSVQLRESLQAERLIDSLWITDYDKKFSLYHRTKIEKFLELNGIGDTNVILCESHPAPVFTDPTKILSWDHVKKTKMTDPKTKKPSITGTFKLLYTGTTAYWDVKADTLAPGIPVFYTTSQEREVSLELLKQEFGEKFIYIPELGLNRIKKMERDYDAKNARTFLAELAKKKIAALSDDEITHYKTHQNNYYTQWISKLDADRIDDPELKKHIKILQKPVDEKIEQYLRYASLPSNRGRTVNATDAYPLIRDPGQSSSTKDHLYLYINAAYAARKEG